MKLLLDPTIECREMNVVLYDGTTTMATATTKAWKTEDGRWCPDHIIFKNIIAAGTPTHFRMGDHEFAIHNASKLSIDDGFEVDWILTTRIYEMSDTVDVRV